MSEGDRKGAIIAIVVAAVVLVAVGIVVVLNWPEKEAPVKVAAPEPVAVKAPEKVEAPPAPKPVEPPPAPMPEAPKVAPVAEAPKVEPAPVAEAPKPAAEPIDVMKALEYREDFKPSGYNLAGGSANMTNPGYVPQAQLDDLKKELGVQATSAYMCLFKSEPRNMAMYFVIKVADASEAGAVRDAVNRKKGQESTKINNFIVGDHVVLAVGSDASVADELFGKLKNAVNFKE